MVQIYKTKTGQLFYLSVTKNVQYMRVLFVAATEFEVEGLKLNLESTESSKDLRLEIHNFRLLTTGVGMVATAYALGRELASNRYDVAINLGIGGSFDRSIALGELVEVTHDTITELGAEDGDNFLPIAQLGFGEGSFKATKMLTDIYAKTTIYQAVGITVNTVHGNDTSIHKLLDRHSAQIESMEGAAFFYACREAGVPCMQIRAVSNYVEKRNRDNWQIGLAVKNLNTFAVDFLRAL
jgi:futalosine hydrolase